MEKVSVNKGLLAGVVAVAAGSLLAVAFLLGRASGPGVASDRASRVAVPEDRAGPASVPPAGEPPPLPSSPTAPVPAPAEAPLAAGPASSIQESGSAPPSAPEPASVPSTGEPVRAVSAAERASVAAYLDAVARIQPGEPNGGAETVASEMAQALSNGDTSGLDGMIRDTEAAKGKLSGLVPPAACAAHYRESLASLDDALEMLRSLKSALESPDPVARLAGVTERATALRSRAEALQREEMALRQRHGLSR